MINGFDPPKEDVPKYPAFVMTLVDSSWISLENSPFSRPLGPALCCEIHCIIVLCLTLLA